MKRRICLCIAVLLLCTLCACGQEPAGPSDTSAQTTAAEETTAPAPQTDTGTEKTPETVPPVPAETEKNEEKPAEKPENTVPEEAPPAKVLIDWNCDTLDNSVVSLNGNKYPGYYFADSSTEGVEKGTVYMGGNAEPNGYSTMILRSEMTTAAFTLEMDMKVDSLMTHKANSMYRGMVLEFELPDNKMIYMVLQDMSEPDGNVCTATVRASDKGRAAENAPKAEIRIPADGKFHKWVIQYDGTDLLRLMIDGKVVQDFAGVNVPHTNTPGRLQIKNIMADMSEDSRTNSVTFDHIKLTEGTVFAVNKIESVAVSPDASAEKFTVTAALNRLEENGELSVSVYPRGEKQKAVSVSCSPESLSTAMSVAKLPFTGVCTVEVTYTGAQPYQFDYYVYRSVGKVFGGMELKSEHTGDAFIFSDLSDVKLPEKSPWNTAAYETAAGKGSALRISTVGGTFPVEIPVKLNGKFAVFIGYEGGSGNITVNGAEYPLGVNEKAGSIFEKFITAVDLNGGQITLANKPFAAARITYVKFLSLSDELYEIAVREDDSHTFITDNDGYSTLCNASHNSYDMLFEDDFLRPANSIDQRQFIWASFSTSILNFDSEVWWEYVTRRLKELNIPEEQWPEDFLDHVNTEGEHLNFDDLMRNADVRAYNNIRILNKIGDPYDVLSGMVAEKGLGEFYVSLRMSHYSSLTGAYAFQSGAFYYLHPEWIREGSYQLSYAHEEYRNYLHDLLIEIAQAEHVTGILMDFGRYYLIFGDELTDTAERTRIMNEFVKSVRDDMPEGKKLTVRVLDPIDEKATVWGLDYKTWVKNGWVDRVYISSQSHETFFDFSEYIEFFEDYPDVELYLGINATLSGHDTTKEEEAIRAAGGIVPSGERVDGTTIMLRVYDFYAAGSDGVFTFNWSGSEARYKNVQNAARMKKWYHFIYPASLVQPQSVRFVG